MMNKPPVPLKKEETHALLAQLDDLIRQTYNIEKEYISLTASYNRLQNLVHQIIEALPNALWVLNQDGTIFLQNSEAKKIVGLLTMIDRTQSEQEIAYENRYFLIKTTRHEEKQILSATDITDQKRRERLASMGQMAAHLAHEIRNPIGSIALLLSTLSKRVMPPNQPIVEEIKRSLYRVERIIKTTLIYSKGVHPTLAPFKLATLIKECQEAIAGYTYTKMIDFRYHYSDQTIIGDRQLLALALQNFLFNAIDAIEESDADEGWVTMDFKTDPKTLLIEIEDSGITLEYPEKIFDAFHTTKTKGHGLGLALALQIIQAHHGTIDVQSQPKRFTIRLPLLKESF